MQGIVKQMLFFQPYAAFKETEDRWTATPVPSHLRSSQTQFPRSHASMLK